MTTNDSSTTTGQQDWYFTFGSGQEHDGKYVVIAGTHDGARDRMFSIFGNRWSHQYAGPDRAGVEQFDLVELPESEWPTPAVDDSEQPKPDGLQVALDLVATAVEDADPIGAYDDYEDCSAEELHIHKQLNRIRDRITVIRAENNLPTDGTR